MGEVVRPKREGDLGSWPPRSKAPQRWAFLLGAGALIVLLFVLTRGPTPPGEEVRVVPMEARGRWTTGDARYAGRSLDVDSARIVLELGSGVPPDEGYIASTRIWREGSNTVVRLEYTTVDGPQVLEMLLEAPDRMRLRNPPEVVWTRIPVTRP